ncbi:riboflavin biosynthesis protein RibD C-terminal domain protein [Verrucomicrobiia bacterium DG1235]|nr:riboflavin biosynthesis protein RibD C-terminal domain protein [Verrucomicrobiae bacterium DG1235]
MLTLIAAQTLDGFIARQNQPGTDFCSDADAAFLRSALKDFDSLVMGRKTYDTLRDRIQNSDTTRYLRKIVTRDPASHAADTKPDLVEFTSAPPDEILAELAKRGRNKTALLGGGEIYTRFLSAGLVDELWITIEPLLFGAGTPLLSQPLELQFKLHSSAPLGKNALLLKYLPQK